MEGGNWKEFTIWLPKLAEQFALLVELHDSAVAISIGNKEFARAGNRNIRWLAKMLLIRTDMDKSNHLPHLSISILRLTREPFSPQWSSGD
jgi:hypothetical protein